MSKKLIGTNRTYKLKVDTLTLDKLAWNKLAWNKLALDKLALGLDDDKLALVGDKLA